MAMYICDECGVFKDDDYFPLAIVGCQDVCPDCAAELEEQEDTRRSGLDSQAHDEWESHNFG